MYTEDKKRIIRLSDWIRDQKQFAIREVATYGFLLLLSIVLFGGFGTAFMVVAFTETNGFAVLIAVFVTASLLFYAIPITGAVFVIRYLSPKFALLCDKFTFDKVGVTHSEPQQRRSRGKYSMSREYTVYITDFAPYGKHELFKAPYTGQTFYVLATTTQKPRIIAVYDTDKYEITQRG